MVSEAMAGPRAAPQHRTVPGPSVPVQRAEIPDQAGAEGIAVEIPDRLEEGGFRFDQAGRPAVLEEMTVALMAAMEGPGVAG
jgi:hypothetical protein